MFQWQTNGSMSMAKSSNIAAVWILKSERGGAIAGPLWVQHPASTIERHTERKWEPETWAHRQGMGRGCICDWSPRPQGAWSVQHTAAEDMASTRLRGGMEEEWGSWQSAPEVKCSRAPTGQFLQMERGLCLRYTVLVSVNCAELCAFWVLKNRHLVQPFAFTGPTLGSVIPNQHVTNNLCGRSEPYFEHVDAQVCKDTWLNHSERCTKGCKSPLEFCIWCNVAPKNRRCFWMWMFKSIYMWYCFHEVLGQQRTYRGRDIVMQSGKNVVPL